MNFILSLLYAPIIFFLIKFYPLKEIGIGIFVFSLIYIIYSFLIKKNRPFYALIYMFIGLTTYFLNDFIFLKSIPFLISFSITIAFFISYLNKKSIILYFLQKFKKKEINNFEKNYINNCTLFWCSISLINTLLHIFILTNSNTTIWIYYSSVLWPIVFFFGGILQFIHKKFIYKEIN